MYTLSLSQEVNFTHHTISLIVAEFQQKQTHTKMKSNRVQITP